MAYDYSRMDSRAFEQLSKKYLEQKYPDFKWEITPSSGDGNKDILCKYRVFDEEREYWAEAKFTQSTNPHTLLKGQLDPTLVSALLSPKPVSLCFISNNQITETYYYRLNDFKIKTNIGIELVLKEEFEDWLSKNPKQLEDYNIKILATAEEMKGKQTQICSATITDIINSNQYKSENFLLEGVIYYLYIIIDSSKDSEHMKLQTNSEFLLPHHSKLLDDSDDFNLKKGKRVYKFELLPHQVCGIDLKLQLMSGCEIVAEFYIKDLTIFPNITISLSYIQQEKSIYEISRCIQESSTHNFVIPVIGSGATGKTKLMNDLNCELNALKNVLFLSFMGNECLDAKILVQILIFFNIGNVFDYEKEALLSQIDRVMNEEQRIFYGKLINGLYKSPEACVNELLDKLANQRVCLLYPSNSRVQQILLLDDIHKGKNTLSKILEEFISQFLQQSNNQSIVFASREYYDDYMINMAMLNNDWIKRYYLDGLSKDDKMTTISHYFDFNEEIQFDRATDDLIVFSNILQSKLPKNEYKSKEVDSIIENVNLVRSFEHPDIVNVFRYREHLNKLKKYSDLLGLIYLVKFGIEYSKLVQIFEYKDIEFLLEIKVVKRIGGKIFPFHDHYVKAFFEDYIISDSIVLIVKRLCNFETNYEEKYLYLSLLIKSGYHVYCQIENEARDLELYNFKITDYYKAYVLSKELVAYIDFNEKLSAQEIRDMLVLAVSAGYFEEPEKVKKRYNQLVKIGKSLYNTAEILGIVLRAQSEIINIDYWELNIFNLSDNIDTILSQIPSLFPSDNEDIICAYLNLMNRKMVTALLVEDFKLAEELFQKNRAEIIRLDKEEYIGYLYMDYAKGLYYHDSNIALDNMNKAQEIFCQLGTEHRRLLDCTCEVEYLKCLVLDYDNVFELEKAAEALREAQYLELYSKAKLKLAALKLAKGKQHYSEKCIERDLYLSEYVLDYPSSGRLLLFRKMIRNAYYVYCNEAHKKAKLTAKEKKVIEALGNDYQRILLSNETGIKRSIQFVTEYTSSNIYLLDPRIW